MKKFLALIAITALTFCMLTACEAFPNPFTSTPEPSIHMEGTEPTVPIATDATEATEAPTEATEATEATPVDAREPLTAVLKGEQTAYFVSLAKEMYLYQYLVDNHSAMMTDYAFIDFDGDTQLEALAVNTCYDGAYVVLRYYEGRVLAYPFSYDDMQQIKVDGVFLDKGTTKNADGKSDYSWGKLRFTGETFEFITYASRYEQGTKFSVSEFPCTEEDFNNYEAARKSTGDITLSNARDFNSSGHFKPSTSAQFVIPYTSSSSGLNDTVISFHSDGSLSFFVCWDYEYAARGSGYYISNGNTVYIQLKDTMGAGTLDAAYVYDPSGNTLRQISGEGLLRAHYKGQTFRCYTTYSYTVNYSSSGNYLGNKLR